MMTAAERKALLDCRNMLNHLYVFPKQTLFDRRNMEKMIDAADVVLFTPNLVDKEQNGEAKT